MKRKTMIASVLSVLVGLSGIAARGYAAEKPPPVLGPTLAYNSDLTVSHIYAGNCGCSITGLELSHWKGIKVTVKNIGQGATEGMLTVSYFDALANTLKTVTKPVPRLERSRKVDIVAFEGEFLFKEPVGIKAEVKATTVPDSNAANNVKIERRCTTLPLVE